MANLSSFFGDPSAGGGSSNQQIGILRMFGNGCGTYSIPAAAQYVAYGVVGAGGGAQSMSTTAGCCSQPYSFGGAGGGFSYHEMDVSGYSTAITACYKVGRGGCFGRCDCKATNSDGESTCICGDACLTTICATGGQGGCKCLCICGGSGNGGMISHCGGGVFGVSCNFPGANTNLSCMICCYNAAMGGGGAGGFLGQGGCAGGRGGGGSGNGGGGGMVGINPTTHDRTRGPKTDVGSRGVDHYRTGQSLWEDMGYAQYCVMCGCTFEGYMIPNSIYHIPGTMLCNTTRYSMGKQIFGAASSARINSNCQMGGNYMDTQLPGAGGYGATSCNNPTSTKSEGGFMAGGGAGACTQLGGNGGCGGGAGSTTGCTHPDFNPGSQYSSSCCHTISGEGGDGVAFIEYWLA